MGKTIQQMRIEVAEAYPGMAWKNRVRVMPDRQIYAIYRSLQKKKKFDKVIKDKRGQLAEAPKQEFQQLTIFDLWPNSLDAKGDKK